MGNVDAVPVTFIPVPFEFELPEADGEGQQDMRLSIANVSRLLMDELERANATTPPEPILLEYRAYLNDDPAPTPDPPLRLYFSEVEATPTAISGVASRTDVINRRFPFAVYTIERFPALDR